MTNPYTATNHGTMDSMLPGMDDQNHCCHCGHDLGTPPIEDKPGIHGPDSLYYDPDALGEVDERRPSTAERAGRSLTDQMRRKVGDCLFCDSTGYVPEGLDGDELHGNQPCPDCNMEAPRRA